MAKDDAKPYVARDSAPKREPSSARTASGGAKKQPTPIRELMSYEALSESLKDKWTLLGMGIYKYNETDGLILIGATDEIVDSYVNLAKKNVRVRRTLNRFALAGEGIGIALPTFNLVNALLANHGIQTGIPLMASIDSYVARANDHVEVADATTPYDESMDADLDLAA